MIYTIETVPLICLDVLGNIANKWAGLLDENIEFFYSNVIKCLFFIHFHTYIPVCPKTTGSLKVII